MAASTAVAPVSGHVCEYVPAAETTWYAASIFACGCCVGGVNAVHQPGVMLPVSPPTAIRRSFALAVVAAAVLMGLAVPLAVPEPSAVPDNPVHSETTEARSPGFGEPINVSLRMADGLLPTVP